MNDVKLTYTIPSADDLDNPAYQCRVFDRIAVQDYHGKSHFYCLELSAANTFEFGFCRAQNIYSLFKDVMTVANMKALQGSLPRLMIPSVPSNIWVKYARKYDPRNIVMWIANSIELTPEYKECIRRLHLQGMQFAVRIDAMQNIMADEETLSRMEYILVNKDFYPDFKNIIASLRDKYPHLKVIGFKDKIEIFNFTEDEAKEFDLVLGTVMVPMLEYTPPRPKWQHDMLRIIAQLYSSIYDIKEIGETIAQYPLMVSSMKKMMASKPLSTLTVRLNQKTSDNQGLTQNDFRNFMVIAVAYNLFTLTDKQITDSRKQPFSLDNINYEPFIQALVFGKLADMVSQNQCDDVDGPQGFMAGLMRYAGVFLHDTKEAAFAEFPLDAATSCYREGSGQLGNVLKALTMLTEHKIAEAMSFALENGINIAKDKIYYYISQSYIWADAVIKAIGIIHENKE